MKIFLVWEILKLIGISGLFGKTQRINELYKEALLKIHETNGVYNAHFQYEDKNVVLTLIMRNKIALDCGNENFYQDENHVVLIEGYICPDLIPDKLNTMHTARWVLSSYLNKGLGFIEKLNGEYNIVLYYKRNNTIKIINDRFASRPFYYLSFDRMFYFGSERKSIFSVLNQNIKICPNGLMELFLFGHNLNSTTIYKNVKAMPPATILEFKDNKINASQYWNLHFRKPTRTISEKEMIEKATLILHAAANKRLKGKQMVGLGLSGGLDSRVISALIPKDINKVLARTYGIENSMEVEIAKEIAKKCNFNHYIQKAKYVHFSKFLFPAVWRTEGGIPFSGLKSIIDHRNLKDLFWYNLGGHFGDVLSGKSLKPFSVFPMKKDRFIQLVFHEYSKKICETFYLKKLFNPEFFNKYFPESKETFIESFKNITSSNNWDLYDTWDLTQRQPRFTFNSSAVDNYLFQRILLFTDYNYVDFMLQLNLKQRFYQLFYKKMIATNFECFSHLSNANTGRLLKRSNVLNLSDIYFQYVLKRKRRKRTVNPGYFNKSNLIRKDSDLIGIIKEFITRGDFPGDIFSKNGICYILEQHNFVKTDLSNIISLLLTFIATYNLFFIKTYKKPPEITNPFNI